MENRFRKDKKQLSIFITAGYPTLESTGQQILELQDLGVDFIEVGIPFSDPMADGETIQKTSEIALKNGMNLSLLFQQLEEIKSKVEIPLVLMGYFNPILHYGLANFLKMCNKIGVSQVIIPDLSIDIYLLKYKTIFDEHNVNLIFLITPNSKKEKIDLIIKESDNGFIYLVSQNATTGFASNEINMDEKYAAIKVLCKEIPVMMGFGISDQKSFQNAIKFCDGGIIGTAYLKSVAENRQKEFVKSILETSSVR